MLMRRRQTCPENAGFRTSRNTRLNGETRARYAAALCRFLSSPVVMAHVIDAPQLAHPYAAAKALEFELPAQYVADIMGLDPHAVINCQLEHLGESHEGGTRSC